jgi:elongation factor Ts
VTEISASLVKELRDLTGAGMMECKRALVESGGDVEAARTLLRERGLAQAAKREGRTTTEGRVQTHIRDGRGAIVGIGCETEPVAGNEEFLAFVQHVLDVVQTQGPEAVSNLEDERIELVAKLGENIEVRGAARMEASNGEVVADYVHPPAKKIGVLLRVKGADDALARMLAQHIAALRPQYLTRDEIPEEAIQQEREIYEKLPEVEAKPENIRPQIIEGMITKRFYAEAVLLDQPWVHDSSLTVGKALDERGAEVLEFVRLGVGAQG